jgi:hypothetical protein
MNDKLKVNRVQGTPEGNPRQVPAGEADPPAVGGEW